MAENICDKQDKGSSSYKGKTTKPCGNCDVENPNAAKKCKGCGEPFQKKAKFHKIAEMGKTNPSTQRERMEYRAGILNHHHGQDVVIMTFSKHGKGHTTYVYGTPGAGEEFVNASGMEPGKIAIQLFDKFMREYKKKACNETLTSPPLESPTISTPIVTSSGTTLAPTPSSTSTAAPIPSSSSSVPTPASTVPNSSPGIQKPKFTSASTVPPLSSSSSVPTTSSSNPPALTIPKDTLFGLMSNEGPGIHAYGHLTGQKIIHGHQVQPGNLVVQVTEVMASLKPLCPGPFDDENVIAGGFYEWPACKLAVLNYVK